MINLDDFFSNKKFKNLSFLLNEKGFSTEKLKLINFKKKKLGVLRKKINEQRSERNFFKKKFSISITEEQKNKQRQKKQEIENLEKIFKKENDELKEELKNIPNIPEKNSPIKNKLIKIVGKKWSQKNFEKIDYREIMKKLEMADEDLAVNLSGSGFIIYKNIGSKLFNSLTNLTLDFNEKIGGYKQITIPYLLKKKCFENSGHYIKKFEDQIYKLEQEDLMLIPTSEVVLLNIFAGKKIKEKEQLTERICCFSQSFRREQIPSGKTTGRFHQFSKTELFSLTVPENSKKELKRMLEIPSKILKKLKITHRIIRLSCKEQPFSSKETYDIEVYLPISKRWLEISSCSNCGDFQSRRANIKITKNENFYYPHTLNGTSLAIDRLLIAFCEYYYEKGEIKIPKILKKYYF